MEPQRIPVDLLPDKIDKVTPRTLKKQLDNIGLNCQDADRSKLKEYIEQVREELRDGQVECLGVHSLEDGNNRFVSPEPISAGQWKPSGEFEYKTQLDCIQHEPNFNYLSDNQIGFTGIKVVPSPQSGSAATVDIIKEQYVHVARAASAALIDGINKESIEAALRNAISPQSDQDQEDYNPGWDHVVLYLVNGYNEEKKEAKTVGVMTIAWSLFITDYKNKGETPEKQWFLNMKCWAVLYSTKSSMQRDYLAVAGATRAMKPQMFRIPPEGGTIEIFDKLPPANEDTFVKSLPVISRTEHADAIVMYAPDLQQIGSIDNSKSNAASSWSKSVTSGFTFETTQELNAMANFEASTIVAKAGYSFGIAVSFTSQWSKETTETISFTVPANEMAFTYQGTIYSRIIRYDPSGGSGGSYAYEDAAKFLTSVIVSTSTPLIVDD